MFSIDARIGIPGSRRAVVADADPQQRAALARHLEALGFTVAEASDGIEALTLIGEQSPALALLQQGDDGRAAALARMLYPRTRIVLTADDPASDGDPFPVLARPVDLRQLERCLEQAEVAA